MTDIDNSLELWNEPTWAFVLTFGPSFSKIEHFKPNSQEINSWVSRTRQYLTTHEYFRTLC